MTSPFYIPEEEKKIFLKSFSTDSDIEPFSVLKGESIKLTINEKLMRVSFFVLFFFIILIFLKLFFLQIIEGNYWIKIAEGKEVRIEEIPANRGIIYDRNMQPLVRNAPKFSLYFTPKKLPQDLTERENVFKKIEKIIGRNSLKPADFANNSEEPILIKENLSQREAILFETQKDFLPGFFLEIKRSREYLGGEEFSHLLGYLGKVSKEEQELGYSTSEEVGKIGLEKYYDSWLRGRAGRKRVEPDNNKVQRITAIEMPQDGSNIVLTIDLELQKKVSQALRKWTESSGGKGGAAVVLSPKNGEILALVSFPFFDNNLFSQGISDEVFKKITSDPKRPLFFRAISGEYPSGSTIKPAIALAALEEGVINEKTTVMSTGGVQAGKWFFADWKKGGHGPTNLKKALAESVNTFFYTIGGGTKNFNGLGPEKISIYLKKFGLGNKTGIDLLYEKDGFIPTPQWKKEKKKEDWFVGDTYNISIGHGDFRVTPLQIANLTAGVALGKVFQPHVLKKIFSKEMTQNIEEKVLLELPFKKENLELVKEGLREAVVSGTARALNNFPLAVAGKTGTVEVEKEKPHSWFTCFTPFENPEIVVTVIVENGGEGSGPALKVAKETLEWWYINRYNKK